MPYGLDASSRRETVASTLFISALQRQRTWSPSSCDVFSIYSSVQGSAFTVMLIVEQPLLCSRDIFQPLRLFIPGTSPAPLPPFVFRTCFFFVFFLAGPPARRSMVCVCLTLAGGRATHHLYIQFLFCSSGWEGAGLRSGMWCRWRQRQSSVYWIKFSAFSDVR